MAETSLFESCVTGQCEPSACVRLKPSPRQTLSKNGTVFMLQCRNTVVVRQGAAQRQELH